MNKLIVDGLLFSHRRLDEVTGCWLATRGLHRTGYAYIKMDGKSYSVHRLSMYVYRNFDLNSELKVLHKSTCPNKRCWNPDHLYIGTQQDNVIDSMKADKGFNNRNKTHCINGHEFNRPWILGVQRVCKECKKLDMRRRREIKKRELING